MEWISVKKRLPEESEICEKIEELILKLNVNAIPYQCCPKCNGEGFIPSSGTATTKTCDVCNGAKIIPMHQILTEPKTDS